MDAVPVVSALHAVLKKMGRKKLKKLKIKKNYTKKNMTTFAIELL